MPSATATFRFPEASHGGALLRHHEDVPVLTVEGTPQEIGEAVGVLAVRPAPRMSAYPDDLLRHYRVRWLRPYLVWAGERLVRNLDAQHRAEFEAIARSAGIDRARIVLGNTLFDVKKFLACSAMLVEPSRSATGGTLLGRNLDYPALSYAHEYSLVTVYRPAGKKAFVSIGFPGLVGVLSGMNESGLALGVLEVFQSQWFTRRLVLGGIPYAVCFRTILETCDTVEEAKARLEQLPRTTIFNLAVADTKRVAVFEVTPRRVRELSAAEGTCVCTNHFRLEAHRPLWSFNVYKTFDRERILRQRERSCEAFDLADVHAGLHAANQGDHTLQTMVFEPQSLRLHVGLGELPSTAGPLRTLELADLLR
jgi:isopenicillin-N N-acyltransferase like protein